MHMCDYRPSTENEDKFDLMLRVTLSPDGELVASESVGMIRLWNLETGDCCLDYEGHYISFSSDGKLVISASEDGVRILDLASKNHRFFGKGYSYHPVLSPDGQRVAAASLDGSIQLWNTQNGDNIFTIEGSKLISGLIFSPTGNLIASGSYRDDGARVWNTRTGDCVATYTPASEYDDVFVVFSPNGELLALGGTNPSTPLQLWDVLTGSIRSNLEGRSEPIDMVVFSPNSQLIAAGGPDARAVWLWDTQRGEHLLTIPHASLKPRIEFVTEIGAVFVNGMAHEIGSAKMTKAEIASHSHLLSDLQIDSSREWVTKGSERVLWLPPERRPRMPDSYAVWRNKIAIGARNGDMTFLTIEDEPGRQ
ncbi:MAG: hypothetical protein LQ338_007531, partial [Usnochroma carphineum]